MARDSSFRMFLSWGKRQKRGNVASILGSARQKKTGLCAAGISIGTPGHGPSHIPKSNACSSEREKKSGSKGDYEKYSNNHAKSRLPRGRE